MSMFVLLLLLRRVEAPRGLSQPPRRFPLAESLSFGGLVPPKGRRRHACVIVVIYIETAAPAYLPKRR